MTWIATIEPDEARGRLARIYERVRPSGGGHVDNILTAHSLRPSTLEGHLALYKAALHRRPCALSPREREVIGVCVSRLNGCEYCVRHHQAGLSRHLGGDAGLAAELASASTADGDEAVLTERERVMCAYARKLTRSPADMTRADLDPLRACGLDDAAILDLNQVVAYFAYANRTVLGLGVEIGGEALGLHPTEGDGEIRHR